MCQFLWRPIHLSLMVEAPIIQEDVKRGFRGRQMKDISCSKSYTLDPLFSGQAPGALDGQRLIINSRDLETELRSHNGVASLAATDIQ